MLHACPRAMIADSGEVLPNQPPKPYTNRTQTAEKGTGRAGTACYDFARALQLNTSKAEEDTLAHTSPYAHVYR